jgi:ribosomal protein S18 acetylase RimI-like enzyme
MSNFPTNFNSNTVAINSESLDDESKLALKLLSDKGYEVHRELTRDFASEIIKLALEPNIKEYCPNDSGRRFANLESTAAWLAKGRAAYLLLQKTDNGDNRLVGYGWAGDSTSSHVPQGETTFSLRLGESGQGKGLATSFSRIILLDSAKTYEANKYWLETWESNAGAVHIYKKLGFSEVDRQQDMRPTNSGQQIEDTRLYMYLPDVILN